MKKRIIPVFVAVLMVFTMMPMMAGSVYADSFYYEEDGLNYKIKETVATCIGVEDENGKASAWNPYSFPPTIMKVTVPSVPTSTFSTMIRQSIGSKSIGISSVVSITRIASSSLAASDCANLLGE